MNAEFKALQRTSQSEALPSEYAEFRCIRHVTGSIPVGGTNKLLFLLTFILERDITGTFAAPAG